MKKRFLVLSLLLFIVCSFNLLAINFPEKANKIEDFIPKGWKKLVVKQGDLNKDKIDDVVLIIEKNDPKNFRKAESLFYAPKDSANFNPRIILVLLKDKNSQYNLVAKNEEGFITSEGKSYEEVIQNIDNQNSISIKNNTLRIYTSFEAVRAFYSTEYTFRYQNNKFELIGLEAKDEDASGYDIENNRYSINFSTKKLEKYTSKEKTDSNEKAKEEKSVKNIDIKDKYILDTMKETTVNEILDKYVYKNY
ncbi:hypothetical protein [Fusobacterium canifelinum]|uniref:Lipoprotein n=1 Tax=Fusobacterium canifelinum TaxID=285729 RepID=A0A3P1UR53_9FUSO|nr:hypothetical protein [Fusobacterium canifelinum]QQB74932.1 hypothetical protein I6H56_05635 [Fusobacterium canifelinum]RRD24379.1 hypothetical protein EII27_07280 [Fusobacterium canifelinum]